MFLKQLNLIHFKNYTGVEFSFSPGVNVLTGHNGAGKTNVLDAIHYLCLTKSFLNPIDSQNILNGQDFFVLTGNFELGEKEEQLYCGVKRNQKKVFKRNKKDYERLSDHVGMIPLVIVAPNDASLISEGSEERRKFLDAVISQLDQAYLNTLIQYHQTLHNRNALLKQFAERRHFDATLLEIYDEQLIPLANTIFERRKTFMKEFIPFFQKAHAQLSGGEEEVSLEYQSQLADKDMKTLLLDGREKDRILERSNYGIHKDDLNFTLEGQPLKRRGSQGQQKTFLFALKLAQHQCFLQQKGSAPLLLLDDLFDKLDEERMKNLATLLGSKEYQQVIITDTSAQRVKQLFAGRELSIQILEISKGVLQDA